MAVSQQMLTAFLIKMEYRGELDIAKKAEQMLTSALKSHTQSFADHYNRKEGQISLKEVSVTANLKRYGKKKDGNQHIYMRSLSVKMAKHGFVQHYGVDTIRKGSERTRTKPQSKTYSFSTHYFRMKAQPFINTAIQQSGVLDFVTQEVGRLRLEKLGEELVFNLKQFEK